MDDEWRDVVGFEGYYRISSQGEVRSVLRTVEVASSRQSAEPYLRTVGERTLSQSTDRHGYQYVTLSVEGEQTRKKVHHLVAEAYFGPRPDGLVVRHLDGNAANNTCTNLAYGTQSENLLDAVAHGTHGQSSKTHCKRGHVFDDENTIEYEDYPGRHCRTCIRERNLRAQTK